MELILIRHGLPELVRDSIGPADPELTSTGRLQALAVAGWLATEPIDALYVSPMARARQTSEPIERLLQIEAAVRPGIREIDADSNSYVPEAIARSNPEEWQEVVYQYENADRSDFADTVIDTLETIVQNHKGERVVATCHGGVINVWAAHILGLPKGQFFCNPYYTSINRFMAASSGHRSVASLNETGHLRAPGLT